jgi:hypothetical protein
VSSLELDLDLSAYVSRFDMLVFSCAQVGDVASAEMFWAEVGSE